MPSFQMILFLFSLTLPVSGYAQATCVAPKLSDQQVKDIVDKARASRKDLLVPFRQQRWSVRRQGCHYAYIESGLPEAPERSQAIILNQHGVIVDTQIGNSQTSSLTCPDRVFTESELTEIVRKERERRKELPPAFSTSRIRVSRLRCLYLYFEYAVPERRGDYQVFTIDPLGEVMAFSRSKPY